MKYLLYAFLLMNFTWVWYLAIMHLREAKDAGTLTGFIRWLGYANLFVGLILDALVNALPVSVIMLELPHEWLTTARLSRHIKDGGGWRRAVALWLCRNLLSTFDSTKRHCGEQ